MKYLKQLLNLENRSVIFIILTLSLTLSYLYYNEVILSEFSRSVELHSQILNNEAYSPYQYRILVPNLLNLFIVPISSMVSYNLAFKVISIIYFFSCITIYLSILYSFLSKFFDNFQSLFGIMIIGITIPLALRDHYYQPWTILEALFILISMILIEKDKFVSLILILILATLNRETAVLIPLLYFFIKVFSFSITNKEFNIEYKNLSKFLGLIFVWLVIFFGLRMLLPSNTDNITLASVWEFNTSKYGLFKAFINISMFLGFLWIYLISGFKQSPDFIKKSSLIIPIYLLAVLLFGMWYEVRLLIILYPLFIPIILSRIFNVKPKN